MDTAPYIWLDGEFVPWDEAQVHVLTHGLHYGTGVFEGVRCYDTELGPAVFRHPEHVERLFASAKLYYMDVPFTREQIREATLELIAKNEQRECYIRPLVFRGHGEMGLFVRNPMRVAIASWKWDSLLGDAGKTKGVRAKVSSWRRTSHHSLIPHAKAAGHYLNSVLAKNEVGRRLNPDGTAYYEEALLLDERGFLSEGSGENLFVVKGGKIYTPPQTAGILDGITRSAVMQIIRDHGYELIERDIARAEAYLADEVFMTGTAAELVPVVEIDDIAIGDGTPGPETQKIQATFQDALHGRDARYTGWLDLVPTTASAA
ncbi:MAG: branched-chain amino acid transaminase [Patulibacter minatonensis]